MAHEDHEPAGAQCSAQLLVVRDSRERVRDGQHAHERKRRNGASREHRHGRVSHKTVVRCAEAGTIRCTRTCSTVLIWSHCSRQTGIHSCRKGRDDNATIELGSSRRATLARPHAAIVTRRARRWPAAVVVPQLSGDRDRQLEPPRTGAAGIEEEHASVRLDRRLMRVTEDHRREACRRRVEVEL